MARSVPTGTMTPADELRALLTDSEKLLGNVRGQGAAAARLLENLDRIAELWPALQASGVDLRAEAGRWQTVQALTHKYAAGIVRELRAAGGLAAMRAAQATPAPAGAPASAGTPPSAGTSPTAGTAATPDAPQSARRLAWWWYLDNEVHERTRKRTTRLAIVGAIVVVALAGGILLLQKLFPTDPRVEAASRYINNGQQKIDSANDYAGALADFQAAAQALPSDPEPWIWVGVTEQQLGHTDAAQQAFARAQELAGQQDFLLTRASIYTQFKQAAPALADIDAVLKADPENPQAYYYRATVYEAQGRTADAVADLDKASQYADKRNMPQLVAVSRVRMGMLMQRLNTLPDSTPTPGE